MNFARKMTQSQLLTYCQSMIESLLQYTTVLKAVGFYLSWKRRGKPCIPGEGTREYALHCLKSTSKFSCCATTEVPATSFLLNLHHAQCIMKEKACDVYSIG